MGCLISTMFSRFIHIVEYISSSFLLLGQYCSMCAYKELLMSYLDILLLNEAFKKHCVFYSH
jgi:hypothetical protein